jgi:hypothetical protein
MGQLLLPIPVPKRPQRKEMAITVMMMIGKNPSGHPMG